MLAEPGSSKILQFITAKKMEVVEKNSRINHSHKFDL